MRKTIKSKLIAALTCACVTASFGIFSAVDLFSTPSLSVDAVVVDHTDEEAYTQAYTPLNYSNITPLADNNSWKVGDNLTASLSLTGNLVISGLGNMYNWSEFDGSKAPWLESKKNVRSVVIEEGVTSIGSFAFLELKSLKSVTISSTVENINECAFKECESLTSVQFKTSVSGGEVFGVQDIGVGAFFSCSHLSAIDLPQSVNYIQDAAFANCKAATSLTLPKSLRYIGMGAFYACSSLKSIVISEGIARISEGAFENCTKVTSVVIPKSVKTIEWFAFEGCNKLSHVYYGGTPADWSEIEIEEFILENEPHINELTNATRYYYSETEPNGDSSIGIKEAWYWKNGEVDSTPVEWYTPTFSDVISSFFGRISAIFNNILQFIRTLFSMGRIF